MVPTVLLFSSFLISDSEFLRLGFIPCFHWAGTKWRELVSFTQAWNHHQYITLMAATKPSLSFLSRPAGMGYSGRQRWLSAFPLVLTPYSTRVWITQCSGGTPCHMGVEAALLRWEKRVEKLENESSDLRIWLQLMDLVLNVNYC